MKHAICLRPHHLLCIQKYMGYGYDEAFTLNMDRLVCLFKSNPDARIVITEGGDDLCASCPNYTDNACLSEEKTDLMDKKVLAYCRLSYSDTGNWRELSGMAGAIFGTAGFEDICGDCQWKELCDSRVKQF